MSHDRFGHAALHTPQKRTEEPRGINLDATHRHLGRLKSQNLKDEDLATGASNMVTFRDADRLILAMQPQIIFENGPLEENESDSENRKAKHKQPMRLNKTNSEFVNLGPRRRGITPQAATVDMRG